MKIAVVTIATRNLNYRDYSIENSKDYCHRHGYDFILYEDKIEPDSAVITNKTIAVLENIDKYDWIFMKDADSLFYNLNTRIEKYIDNDYNYIGSWSKMGEVNLGHLLIKCDPQIMYELNSVLSVLRDRIKLKGEQPVYNEFWNEKRISPIKILPKHILNAHPIGKKNWGEWLTWEEFEARVKENRDYEKYSDINKDSFIVHYPGTFMKTRNEYTEHMVNTREDEDIVERWNFSEEYLQEFKAMHEKIKRMGNLQTIKKKSVSTNCKPRIKRSEMRKIKHNNPKRR